MKHVSSIRYVFEQIGRSVYENRWKAVIACFFINGAFGLGLLSLALNNNTEELNQNIRSQTKLKADKLNELYPDKSGTHFKDYSSVKGPLFVEVIISGKGRGNMLNTSLLQKTSALVDNITNLTITSYYLSEVSYMDLCAKTSGHCVIEGYATLQKPKSCKDTNACSFSIQELNVEILQNIGNYSIVKNTITHAQYLKFRFYLRQDTQGYYEDSKKWQHNFLKYMSEVQSNELSIVYRHSTSFLEELGEDTYPDIRYFALTFTILLFYFGFYISGGDCVSKRINIGRMGTIVVPLSVLGAWGLIVGTGLEFTNTVGVMPYYALFHEVNNMLITFNAVSEQPGTASAKVRVSKALRNTGIPITIVTAANMVMFAVGTRSAYKAMQLFSKFTVGTLIFMYVNHMIFFTACLAIHEKRIDDNRHFCTCATIKKKRDVENNRSCCYICCCTGERPASRNDTASSMENASRKLLSPLVLKPLMKWLTLLIFFSYIGISIWKTTSFKVEFLRTEYVTENSYFRKFEKVNNHVYGSNFYISFVLPGYLLYDDPNAIQTLQSIKNQITSIKYMDSSSLISWLDAYANFTHLNTSNVNMFSKPMTLFLSKYPKYRDDIVASVDGRILSSRFYIQSQNIHSLKDIVSLKQALLEIDKISDNENTLEDQIIKSRKTLSTNASSAGVGETKTELANLITLYAPDFIYIDKYMAPLIESLIMIATLLVVALVLLMLVCPHLVSLIYILVWPISIELGLFGFMSIFNIAMTSYSMIITVLVSCYTVDVVVHSLYTFYNKAGTDRQTRAHETLSSTSHTLFITTLGSFLGQLVIFLEKSYAFLTTMKILMMASAVCCIHAGLFIPVVLSFFGPKDENRPTEEHVKSLKKVVIPQLANGTKTQMNKPDSLNANRNNSLMEMKQDVTYDNQAYQHDSVMDVKL